MTTTYDPSHKHYYDEADLRVELERVFEICHGCRLCFNLCPAFPTLFDTIDSLDGAVSRMQPSDHDRVIDECYQCKLCYLKCPYIPPHEWELDFPRLIARAYALRRSSGKATVTERVADQFLGRTDLLGKASTSVAPLVNMLTSKRGSASRRVMQRAVGIASERLLPPYARQRFSTWFARRNGAMIGSPRGEVAVFPTCFVEYMEPAIGMDLVKVYERNDVSCVLADGARCCGAPWLHGGNVPEFRRSARRNVTVLAAEVRAGRDVVVPQPTCAYVIRKDYPRYLGGIEGESARGAQIAADAAMVAEHTFDAAEYLLRAHRNSGRPLDTEFNGHVPEKVTYHLSCHTRAQTMGSPSRDLLALAGMKVNVLQGCSGIDGTWGYRAENYALAKKVAGKLCRSVDASSGELCGDCHLANGAIREETGLVPLHPLQLLARAYGIPEERST
ncbi:MAG: heterodisulfide reductase-related iron-sulfur binding cluster [Actinomycetota bacterium]|nr:heterodisulfide reductase-related iron-sulfur binding cluster [Actinomycetota bacterium]